MSHKILRPFIVKVSILGHFPLSTKIINVIVILYRDTKSMVWSPDSDTEYFNINEVVL